MKYEFGGTTTEVDREIFVKDVFENLYDDIDEQFYLSKKTFKHEEEGFNFDYKYAIRVINMEEVIGEKLPVYVSLLLIVSPNSLNKEVANRVQESIGEWEGVSENWKYKDISDYGFDVVMGEANIEDDGSPYYGDNKNLQHTLKSICYTYECTDSLRGFYLDKSWNMLGSNGWDIIRKCIIGEDFVQSTLKRYEGIEN